MRLLFALPLLALATSNADAQIIRVPQRSAQPAAWIAFNAGLLDLNPVSDGGTGTTWHFAGGIQYRVSIEQAMRNDAAFGITATFARLPLAHEGDETCLGGTCDAHGDVWQALANFRMGGGEGFHQVIEFTAGVTHFRNFTTDDGGDALAPRGGDNDFTIGVGYGFGFGFSQRSQIFLVQDFVTSLHQRDGLGGGTSSFVRHGTTRIGLRVGLGSRSRF